MSRLDKAHFKILMRSALVDPIEFVRCSSRMELRQYQQEAASAIVTSVLKGLGHTFVVMFPRQSGKNELQAQIEAYLLTYLSACNAEIVKISPTWQPQSQNAMRRLERVLRGGLITGHLWLKESGYIYRINTARIYFFSGEPKANIVGATASTLLEVDEAQDVCTSKYDKEIAPMAASTNATRVFWGTAWTADTLLGRELREARRKELDDGIQRTFVIDADLVAQEVPNYGIFVAEQVRRMGRSHPMIRTQYYSEEIDAESGMFPPGRLQMMRGTHDPREVPQIGRRYAFLIDVGGEASAVELGDTQESQVQHDATALTIVEIDPQEEPSIGVSIVRYLVVNRRKWVGEAHSALFRTLLNLTRVWAPKKVVVDATGIGAGLSSFLANSLGSRLVPFLFNAATKTRLGWDFIALCETGRFQDYRERENDPLQVEFWAQARACQMDVSGGPERSLRWGVPDSTRGTAGEPLHDDLLLSAALCAELDRFRWTQPIHQTIILPGKDPLNEIRRGY